MAGTPRCTKTLRATRALHPIVRDAIVAWRDWSSSHLKRPRMRSIGTMRNLNRDSDFLGYLHHCFQHQHIRTIRRRTNMQLTRLSVCLRTTLPLREATRTDLVNHVLLWNWCLQHTRAGTWHDVHRVQGRDGNNKYGLHCRSEAGFYPGERQQRKQYPCIKIWEGMFIERYEH